MVGWFISENLISIRIVCNSIFWSSDGGRLNKAWESGFVWYCSCDLLYLLHLNQCMPDSREKWLIATHCCGMVPKRIIFHRGSFYAFQSKEIKLNVITSAYCLISKKIYRWVRWVHWYKLFEKNICQEDTKTLSKFILIIENKSVSIILCACVPFVFVS